MKASARIDRGQFDAAFNQWYRFAEQRMERAALIATDTATKRALSELRSSGAGAGLGRLFQGVGSSSDLQTGRGVHRYPNGGFSASGVLFVRSGSERTRGAIEAYTQGASIRPVRARYLWITGPDLPRVTGRYRMTPELYLKNGFDKKIGPLVFVPAPGGRAYLIVKAVGVNALGKGRSAKSLTKKGLPRKGQVVRENLIAFIGIPRTDRAARIDVAAIMAGAAAELETLFYNALGRI